MLRDKIIDLIASVIRKITNEDHAELEAEGQSVTG